MRDDTASVLLCPIGLYSSQDLSAGCEEIGATDEVPTDDGLVSSGMSTGDISPNGVQGMLATVGSQNPFPAAAGKMVPVRLSTPQDCWLWAVWTISLARTAS